MVEVNTLIRWAFVLALGAGLGAGCSDSSEDSGGESGEMSNSTSNSASNTTSGTSSNTTGGIDPCGNGTCDTGENLLNCPEDCDREMGGGDCQSDADCAGNACMSANGCTCVETPMGNTCAPNCNTDADCPEGPDGMALSCNDGVCSPEGGGEAECGNDVCEMGEDAESCPDDCDGMMAACETDADCEGDACMSENGCSCAETPMGNICVPNCETDDDCPEGPNGESLTCNEGVCGPGEMMAECGNDVCEMGEDAESCPDDCDEATGACETDADCEGDACMGENGCTCVETPMGNVCAPNCETDDDCPEGPNGDALTCNDGVCSPGEMMMAECGNDVCEMGEDAESCPDDCDEATCDNDGVCEMGEDAMSCPNDCDEMMTACETDADCEGDACMSENGCACAETPMGNMCVPSCETDDDCPEGPNGMALVCTDGVCGPGEMMMAECGNGMCEMGEDEMSCPDDCAGMDNCGDDFCDEAAGEDAETCPDDCAMTMEGCETDADCEGNACMSENGCSCIETPMGNVCAPNCETDDDCPEGPNGDALTCNDGVCGPGEMMMAECGNDVCEMGEDAESCPDDCAMPECEGDADCAAGCDAMQGCVCDMGACMPDPCGDGVCAMDEDANSCAIDCMMMTGTCDDDCTGDACMSENGCTCVETPMGNVCAPNCETDNDCPEGPNGMALVCTEGVCGPGETMMAECGNDVCEMGEDAESCPDDCEGMMGSNCDGDGECEMGETLVNCPSDCYAPGTGDSNACGAILADVNGYYDDVTMNDLGTCQMSPAAQEVIKTLLNFDGVSIDNNGETLQPCLEWRCDDTYIYVATTALPHYDFVATTPNPLVEVDHLYRIPLAPQPVNPAANEADNAMAVADTSDTTALCAQAYTAKVSGGAYTAREPGELCTFANDDLLYMYDDLSTGRAYYHKIPCLSTMIMSINGVPGYGPNEGPNPDPYGTPFFGSPRTAGDSEQDALLDLCFAHTANAMHHHGYFDACFERDDEGAFASSYAGAASTYDLDTAIRGGCTEESPVVAWSLDGYPVKGPCVCTERNQDGTCATLKRVRSSWIYQGISAWDGSGGGGGAPLVTENSACETDADCSNLGDPTDYFCREVVVAGEGGGAPQIAARCVQAEYSWCSHRYIDHTQFDTSDDDFVLLDRCNGYEGPDGYAYFATPSFPYVPSCYRAEPSDSIGLGATGGGGMMMGGGDCNNNGQCEMGEDEMSCPNDCGGMMGGGGVGDACETTNDCACDDLALGCACAGTPMGDVCIPACESNDDCPTGGGGPTLTCNVMQGVCVPQM